MHKTMISTAAVATVSLLLGACASWKEPAAPAGAAQKVAVYSTTQLTPNQYRIIDHIWTEHIRSNVKIPTFRNADEGVNALKERAAAVGGTGLLNVMCMDARGYSDGRVLCYGDAIKLN